MPTQDDSYRISLDGEWSLEDLHSFPRKLQQTYYLYYTLQGLADEKLAPSAAHAFQSYPWKGGYSAVNFYEKLRTATPIEDRPKIVSIHYASPGWIELSLVQSVALNIGTVVATICTSASLLNKTYSSIYRGMQERKLTAIKLKRDELAFAKEHIDFVKGAAAEIGEPLGISDTELLDAATGNELRTLKILLSLFRRTRDLSEFQHQEKISLPRTDEIDRPEGG